MEEEGLTADDGLAGDTSVGCSVGGGVLCTQGEDCTCAARACAVAGRGGTSAVK